MRGKKQRKKMFPPETCPGADKSAAPVPASFEFPQDAGKSFSEQAFCKDTKAGLPVLKISKFCPLWDRNTFLPHVSI